MSILRLGSLKVESRTPKIKRKTDRTKKKKVTDITKKENKIKYKVTKLKRKILKQVQKKDKDRKTESQNETEVPIAVPMGKQRVAHKTTHISLEKEKKDTRGNSKCGQKIRVERPKEEIEKSEIGFDLTMTSCHEGKKFSRGIFCIISKMCEKGWL